ncbi:hypothetical protein DPMN_040656 [Dreissena polymorpha]|uniref:Uncharacterized protein n=1 Tax=Dreissena polymorpha TaxID=45954 RepID=A0A9D4CXC7_DREPO|nr:hypothetical protein DPMN_040656 [Dreissena polymorpha]
MLLKGNHSRYRSDIGKAALFVTVTMSTFSSFLQMLRLFWNGNIGHVMKFNILGALALEVLLGLKWVFGYFYTSEAALPVAYLFIIFNSLQGLFVFHCILNTKER